MMMNELMNRNIIHVIKFQNLIILFKVKYDQLLNYQKQPIEFLGDQLIISHLFLISNIFYLSMNLSFVSINVYLTNKLLRI